MKCNNCGSELNGNYKFCGSCGACLMENSVTTNTGINMVESQPQNVQNYAQPINNQMNYKKPKKSHKWLIVLIIVILVVGFVVTAAIFGAKFFKEKIEELNIEEKIDEEKKKITNEKEDKKEQLEEKIDDEKKEIDEDLEQKDNDTDDIDDDTKAVVDETLKVEGNQIISGNYTFTLPENYTAVANKESFTLTSKDTKTIIDVRLLLDTDIEVLKGNLASLKKSFIEKGYDIYNINYNTAYGSIPRINAALSSNNQKMVLSYSKVDDTTVMIIVIGTKSNVYYYEPLNELTPMIKSAVKSN